MPLADSERRLRGAARVRGEPEATRAGAMFWVSVRLEEHAGAVPREPPQCLFHGVSPVQDDPVHGRYVPQMFPKHSSSR